MIFVWGLLEDPTTRSVIDCLGKLSAPFAFVNHADVARTSIRHISDGAGSYRLSCGGASFDLAEISAAYLRPYDYRDYSDYVKPPDETTVPSREVLVHQTIGAWAECSPARVINRPSAEASNHSKLYQAAQICVAGFAVPESLVTNDPAQVRDFQARHTTVVFKSISSVRSVVQTLDLQTLDAIGADAMGPVLFQRYVPGTNVRVHVVGAEAIACAIESDRVDYRYSEATRISQTALPWEVAERCVTLTQRLGLLVAGLDLIVTPRGEWYCLEVNPNPAFSAFELSDSYSIASKVARMLTAQ